MAKKTGRPKKPEKRTRARQRILNDPAFESIREIEVTANDYVAARDGRQAALADEVEFKKALIKAMRKHDLTTYTYDGYIVQLDHIDEDKIKVKKRRAAKADGSQA